MTYYFKAGGQFEQQSSILLEMKHWEAEEHYYEVRCGEVPLTALRQPLEQLGTLSK